MKCRLIHIAPLCGGFGVVVPGSDRIGRSAAALAFPMRGHGQCGPAGWRPYGESSFEGLANSAVLRPSALGGSVDAPSSRSARPWCLGARSRRARVTVIASPRTAVGEADQRPWKGARVPSGTASRLGRQGGACATGAPGQRNALDGASRASTASAASHHWRRIAIPFAPVRRGPRLSRLHRDSRGSESVWMELPPPVRAAESAGPTSSAKRWMGSGRAFGGHPGLTVSEAKLSVAKPAKRLAAPMESAGLFCSPKGGVAAEGGGAHGKRSAQHGLPVAAHAEGKRSARSGCRWQPDQSQAQRGVQSPGDSGRRGSERRQ